MFFIRWTNNPKGDAVRGWSGYMQGWHGDKESAWREYEELKKTGRYLPSEPKKDPSSGYWNSEPELGISGFGFKDENSFNEAQEEAEDIAWHHRDINKQKLYLFKGDIIGEQGADGEDLFTNVTPIKEITAEATYEEVSGGMNEIKESNKAMTKQEFYAKHNIDEDSISWAGSGDFGDAYYVNGDRVLKKTSAKSEFDIAQKLVGNKAPILDCVVDIFAAEIIEGESWILMEELDIDSEIEDYFQSVEGYISEEGLPIQYVHMFDWDETDAPEEIKEFANQIEDINRVYRYLGIEASDVRPENMGYDKNGVLKAFDLHDRSIGETNTMNEIRAIIRQQLVERFGFNNNKSFTPPMDVKSTAKRALSSGAQTTNGGNEGSGSRKAQELANGTEQSHAQMKRLKAFFDANQPGSPEWGLHGGDAAKRWVDSRLSVTHDDNMRTKENMRQLGGGGMGSNDGMGSMNPAANGTSRNHSVWTRVKNRMQNATNEAMVGPNGELLGFQSDDEEYQEAYSLFQIQWSSFLHSQAEAGEELEGFVLEDLGMETGWIKDEYMIQAEMFPVPKRNFIQMHLYKDNQHIHMEMEEAPEELMHTQFPGEVWEFYEKQIVQFIAECKRLGKFLDL